MLNDIIIQILMMKIIQLVYVDIRDNKNDWKGKLEKKGLIREKIY